VRWFVIAARCAHRPIARLTGIGVLACGLVALTPSLSNASEAPRNAPRTTVTIGGASVVLISADDKLYAFVDRLEDNAPVDDAELEIDTAQGPQVVMHGAAVALNKTTAGMFVGPFNRAGHVQDEFLVSLRSSAGTGEQRTQIAYGDAAEMAQEAGARPLGTMLAAAAVSAGIGAIGALLIMLWLRGGRVRIPVRSVRAAQTGNARRSGQWARLA
jgi:hypothetical protein